MVKLAHCCLVEAAYTSADGKSYLDINKCVPNSALMEIRDEFRGEPAYDILFFHSFTLLTVSGKWLLM